MGVLYSIVRVLWDILGVLWVTLDMLGYVESALAYIAYESILVNIRSTFGYIGFIKVNWEYFEA